MDKKELNLKKEGISKGIPKKSKHVLWNYGPSPDNFDSNQNPFTRFYFGIVDKRASYRENTLSELIDILSEQNSGVIKVGSEVNIPVKKSEYGLLFVVYDALRNLNGLNFSERGIIAKRDFEFKSKKVLRIEDYLRTRYE